MIWCCVLCCSECRGKVSKEICNHAMTVSDIGDVIVWCDKGR